MICSRCDRAPGPLAVIHARRGATGLEAPNHQIGPVQLLAVLPSLEGPGNTKGLENGVQSLLCRWAFKKKHFLRFLLEKKTVLSETVK